jgi:ribonuclease HI
MYNHDIEEVCKIRLSNTMEDTIAWHYETHGVFTVKNAYRLAVQADQAKKLSMGSNTNPNGNRPAYAHIWSANVPPKVRIFAWRLSQEGLATQLNRKHRRLTKVATYQICGADEESGHHAVVQCTKARALRKEMRKHWCLSGEDHFIQDGTDWLLMLMQKVDKDVGANILLLFWRAWYLRNDVVHEQGKGLVNGSTCFLISYAESLAWAGSPQQAGGNDRGKRKLGEKVPAVPRGRKARQGVNGPVRWQPPPTGWIKINTDAGFLEESGEASAGIIVRSEKGDMLFTAWQMIRMCSTAEEAEAEACLLGVRLAVEWTRQPAIIEVDCQGVIRALSSIEELRGSWPGVLKELKAVCSLLPSSRFVLVKREGNNVAHTLAPHALRYKEFAVQRFECPEWVKNLVESEAHDICATESSVRRPENLPANCNSVLAN